MSVRTSESEVQNGGETRLNGASLPEARLIAGLELLSVFAYTRVPPMHKKYIHRAPLISISRLFLMHLVATLPEPNLKALAKKLNDIDIHIPPHITPIFGPKLISRPADLSPDEYKTLILAAMPMLFLDDSVGLDTAGKDRCLGLCVARKKLWNA